MAKCNSSLRFCSAAVLPTSIAPLQREVVRIYHPTHSEQFALEV